MTPSPHVSNEMVEWVAKAIRAVMPERVGSPEALADPVRTERWNKATDEMATKYATAALSAMPGTQWMPIETAPKDGTEILLYREDCGAFLGRWDAAVSFLTEAECEASEMTDDELHESDWWGADFVRGYRVSNDGMPTHWQPLPTPPTTAQEG